MENQDRIINHEANQYALRGKEASYKVAALSTQAKNHILKTMADDLLAASDVILAANAKDLTYGKELGLTNALLERLTLSPSKIHGMAQGILDVISLPDPIGEVIESFNSPDGLIINKIRVPLGLLMMIYESRPNVTADAAALALKSGNGIILKGGKEAIHTNSAIADVLIAAGAKSGLPTDAIQLIRTSDRAVTNALMVDTDRVDAIIPRGGPALKKAIVSIAKVPVLMTGSGVCHLYVTDSALPEMATAIAINAKTQRPGVCNAIETLLIHKDYPEALELLMALMANGVHLRTCPSTTAHLSEETPALATHRPESGFSPATEEDYGEEYLDLTLTVKLVNATEEAINHINTYSTGHSESIISSNLEEAEQFMNKVSAACVYHNASTRFTDGGCFGFGCEIGIATQKLHARGPMGLKEITSYQYQIHGTGQIRK